jgi:hypothetical protein
VTTTTNHSANPASRRPDGRPETAAESRFFDLRESGYTGAIDQDGHAVSDVDEWIEHHRPASSSTSGPMSNPGPAVNPAKNPRRAGVSSHHQNGGDGHPRVPDANGIAALSAPQPPELLMRVRDRLERDMSWFLWTNPADGEVVFSPFALAVLVTEIATDHAADYAADQFAELAGEKEAAEDALLDLLHDLEGGAR